MLKLYSTTILDRKALFSVFLLKKKKKKNHFSYLYFLRMLFLHSLPILILLKKFIPKIKDWSFPHIHLRVKRAQK